MISTLIQKKQVSEVFIIISFILELFVVQSIFLHHIRKMQKIPFVSSINQFMDRFLLSMIEINILLAYLSFIDSNLFEVKVLCFLIANMTAVFSDYFLMPKNNPNDMLYTVETSFVVLFRLSSLSLITVVLIDEYNGLFPLSIVASIIMGIYLCYKFYRYGAITYNTKTSSIVLYIKFSLFVSISITISLKIFTPIILSTPLTLFLMTYLLVNIRSNSY